MAAGSRKRAARNQIRCWVCLLAWGLLVGAAAGAGPTAHRLQVPPPIPPAAHIPVEPLGFRAPSRFYLAFRVPSATLDFVDDTHLLFTFHQSTLMHREEKDPEDDEDQTIAAVLLELPEGKVVERTTWRLHDKGRYLWALGHGRFLERERNTLYLLEFAPGRSLLLSRTPYLNPEGQLVSLQFSPNRSHMVVEYREEAERDDESEKSAGQPTLGDVPRRHAHKVRLLVIDTEAGKVEKTATLPEAITLPLLGAGYLEMEQGKGKLWKISLKPFGGEPRKLVEVTSNCQPSLQALSEQAFMAQLCIPNTSDYLMQAYDLEGQKIWEQQWEARYVWGSFDYAANGSRFAYESVQLDHAIATLDPVDENSITGEPVGVFDVADGGLRLVSGADPILSAGQNYALSADGERFAVLRDGAIEVYKLPPAAVR
jgi:hypothetical protein